MTSTLFPKKKALLLLALPALAILVGGWVLLRDEPPHDDFDLRNYRRAVKEEENGFALLETILIAVEWPEDWEEQAPLFGHSKTFDRKRAAEFAAENASIFEKVDRCLAMADLQVPPAETLGDSRVDSEGLRRLCHALESRSRLRIEEGKPEDAYEDAMRLVRLGSRLQRAQGPLIDYLGGLNAQGMGIWRLVQMAARGELPPRLLALGARELRSEFHGDALRDALRAEHVAFSGDLDQWAAGDIVLLGHSRAFFKPNRTKRMLAERIRNLIKESGAPFLQRKLPPLSDPGLAEVYLLRGAGTEVLSFFLGSADGVLESADRHETSWAAARALLAVLAHRAEKGALPGSLQGLVPEYLDTVPIDPYDGKELRYSAAKQIIYSVGSDGVDSGGSDMKEAGQAFADAKEPTLRFDPEAWKKEDVEPSGPVDPEEE